MELKLNWRSEYPDEEFPDSPYLVDDLMKLDVDVIYKKMKKYKKGRKNLGLIPLMASCSIGQIGALNTESYAEQINLLGKIVVTD